MKKKYLNTLVVISILVFLVFVFDRSFSKKNPKLDFTIKTNKEIYHPLDPIYFHVIIKNVSDEHQIVKKEDYPLRIYLLNEKSEELRDQMFPVYDLIYENQISLASGDSLSFLKVIRFHNYLDPFYTGEYELIIKYNQNDSIIKTIAFQEPEDLVEKEIYEEYKELYTKMLYEGKYRELQSSFKELYYKIKSKYNESDYLCYVSFVFFMNTMNEGNYETFKDEFFYVLDKKHNSYCINEFLNAYFNYYTTIKGVNRNSIADFYYSLINRYQDNTILKEVMKLSYKQTFNNNEVSIE